MVSESRRTCYPRIFDVFKQGGIRVTRQFEGLGLGLAISKALVELHGGSIRAESSGPAQGSTFIIEVLGGLKQIGNAPSGLLTEGERQPRQIRILLVEDHHDTALHDQPRPAFSGIFGDHGFRCSQRDRGGRGEAIRCARQ